MTTNKKTKILDFFKVQSDGIKIACPACNSSVYKSKLNEHLDLFCSSSNNCVHQLKNAVSNSKPSVSSDDLKSNCEGNNCVPRVPTTSSKLNLKKQRRKRCKRSTDTKNKISYKDSDDDVIILGEVSSSTIPTVTGAPYEQNNSEFKNKKLICSDQQKAETSSVPECKEIAECKQSSLKVKAEHNEIVTDNKTDHKIIVSRRNILKRRATFPKIYQRSKVVKSITPEIKTDVSSINNPIHPKKETKSFNLSDKPNIKLEVDDELKCLDDQSAFSELSDSNEDKNEAQQKTYIPYYIANFKQILETVLSNEDNKNLFNEEDNSFVNAFKSLSDSSQKIYVRLFQRKYKWQRINKINYPDITTNPFNSLEELSKARLVDSGLADIDLETAINLLSLQETKNLAKHFNFNSGKSKSEISSMLIKHTKQHKSVFFLNGQNGIAHTMLKKVKQMIGPCYRLSLLPRRLFTRILMLFNLPVIAEDDDDAAGGQQQQLLTLLQINKGELKFPEYQQTRVTVIFDDREELIRYEEARQLENDIHNAVELKKFEEAKELYIEAKEEFEEQCGSSFIQRAQSLPVFLKRYTSFHVYIRCMTQGVEVLQKLREYKEAVSLLRKLLKQNMFCLDYRGRWYDRLALNLEQHLKKPQEALESVKQCLEDKNVRIGHRYSLLIRALRITKSLDDDDDFKKQLLREADVVEAPKVSIKGRLCPRSILGRRHVFVSSSVCSQEDVTVLGVEQLALEHYQENGYTEGIHGEGSTFISLYALLFWDIIYDGRVPDVFISPYQTHPMDLNSDSFFINREKQILSHLETLQFSTNDDLKEIIQVSWEKNHGKASLVSWDRFTDLGHVQGLVSCLGNNILSGICERLARDFRFTRSGVPDLVVWNPETLQVKIVEVKGPGDKLSSKQILWLDYLIKLGADAEVCLVEAVASKMLRK